MSHKNLMSKDQQIRNFIFVEMQLHEKCFIELISQHNKYLLSQPHYFTSEKKRHKCV